MKLLVACTKAIAAIGLPIGFGLLMASHPVAFFGIVLAVALVVMAAVFYEC